MVNMSNRPEISIPGFHGYDYTNAVEVDEITKRTMITGGLRDVEDGVYFADAHIRSTGDTLILVIRNKRTGDQEVYDLKVRAHYFQDVQTPMTTGRVVKIDQDEMYRQIAVEHEAGVQRGEKDKT